MHKLLNVTNKVGETKNSRKSNSMSIDEPSDEGSLSVVRLFPFHSLHIYYLFIYFPFVLVLLCCTFHSFILNSVLYERFWAFNLCILYWYSNCCILINHRGQLLDLAVSLLPGLDTKEISTLFTAIKPLLQVCQYVCIILWFNLIVCKGSSF